MGFFLVVTSVLLIGGLTAWGVAYWRIKKYRKVFYSLRAITETFWTQHLGQEVSFYQLMKQSLNELIQSHAEENKLKKVNEEMLCQIRYLWMRENDPQFMVSAKEIIRQDAVFKNIRLVQDFWYILPQILMMGGVAYAFYYLAHTDFSGAVLSAFTFIATGGLMGVGVLLFNSFFSLSRYYDELVDELESVLATNWNRAANNRCVEDDTQTLAPVIPLKRVA